MADQRRGEVARLILDILRRHRIFGRAAIGQEVFSEPFTVACEDFQSYLSRRHAFPQLGIGDELDPWLERSDG